MSRDAAFAVVLCAVLASPAIGAAQQRDAPEDEPETAHEAFERSHAGVSVLAGVGFEGFVTSALRDLVADGPAWSVRVAMGNREAVLFEAAYVGSRQTLRGMASGALVAHGASGLFRINIAPELRFQPFFYVGAGWSRYSVAGGAGDGGPAPPLASRDHVIEFPFGVGASYRVGALVLDLRAGMRAVSDPDLLPNAMPNGSEDSESMHRYGVTAQLGYSL